MTAEPTPPSEPKDGSDAPSKADLAALGIGCLVAIIILVAVVVIGISRG